MGGCSAPVTLLFVLLCTPRAGHSVCPLLPDPSDHHPTLITPEVLQTCVVGLSGWSVFIAHPSPVHSLVENWFAAAGQGRCASWSVRRDESGMRMGVDMNSST